MNTPFQVPRASLKRARNRLKELAKADTPAAALAALFLLHCELKDIEGLLPPAEQPSDLRESAQLAALT